MVTNRDVSDVAIILISTHKISMSEYAFKFLLLVGDHDRARPASCHGIQGTGYGVGGFRLCKLVAWTHDVRYACEQLSTQIAALMHLGIIFGLKTAGLE